MNEYLFVYGTLMRSASGAAIGQTMRARLESDANWLGPATISGMLYDLGCYPGLVLHSETDASGAIAHGEVFGIRRPEILSALDRYEGLPKGSLKGSEYERTRAIATLATGTHLQVWVYALIARPAAIRHLPSGRWSTADDRGSVEPK